MRSILVAVALWIAMPAAATITTSAIRGRVVSGDRPASTVTVEANSPSLQHPRTTVTGPNGTYWLGALPPGAYEVTFSGKGLQTLTRRVVVALARVARMDVKLEPSEDEESVTSTVTTLSVADTTAITTHFTDEELDRLPVRRDSGSANGIAPEPSPLLEPYFDDVRWPATNLTGGETVDELVIARGALPVEFRRVTGVGVEHTRTGGEDFFMALRDTLTSRSWIERDPRLAFFGSDGLDHFVEAAAGGSVIRDRLWLFAAGWTGDEADRYVANEQGYEVKLTSQLGARHSLTLLRVEADALVIPFNTHSDLTSLRFTSLPTANITAEAIASRGEAGADGLLLTHAEDTLLAKVSWFLASGSVDHLLAAGTDLTDDVSAFELEDGNALFLSDRVSLHNVTLNLGVRQEWGAEKEGLRPRFAMTYDLRGDGRHAIAASYSEYVEPNIATVREATLGFATAIGSAGLARADVIRRRYDSVETMLFALDSRYRLFDRYEFAATYAYSQSDGLGSPTAHLANAWFGAEFPIGEQRLGFTVLQRYLSGAASFADSDLLATDLALRYTLPVSRTSITLAGDVTNLFDQRDRVTSEIGRTLRFWVRARI